MKNPIDFKKTTSASFAAAVAAAAVSLLTHLVQSMGWGEFLVGAVVSAIAYPLGALMLFLLAIPVVASALIGLAWGLLPSGVGFVLARLTRRPAIEKVSVAGPVVSASIAVAVLAQGLVVIGGIDHASEHVGPWGLVAIAGIGSVVGVLVLLD